MPLEDLNDSDLERIAAGDLEGLSDQALEVVASGDMRDAVGSGSSQAPGVAGSFMSGLGGKEQHQGFSLANIAEEVGQGAGPIVAGTVGAAKGAAVGMALGGPPGAFIGGVAGAGLGSGAGRLAQTGLQNVAGAFGLGRGVTRTEDALSEAGREGAAGALGAAAGPVLAKGATALGKEAVKRTAGVLGGISAESFERLVARPREVMKLFSTDKTVPAEAGEAFKSAIKENLNRAGQAYEDLIGKVVEGPKYQGQTFNLMEAVGQKLAEVQNKFGYGMPGRFGGEGAESDVFNRLNTFIQSKQNATAKDLYYLQRDLGNITRDQKGSTLGAALGEVRDTIKDYLATNIAEIGEANQIYSKAKELDSIGEKFFANKADIVSSLKSADKRNTVMKDAAEKIANGIPEARKALEGLRDAIAGQEFGPVIAPPVRTGLTAGLGYLLGTAPTSGAALAAAPFLSPRVTGYMVGGAARASQAIGQAAARVVPEPLQQAGSAIAQFYNSPEKTVYRIPRGGY